MWCNRSLEVVTPRSIPTELRRQRPATKHRKVSRRRQPPSHRLGCPHFGMTRRKKMQLFAKILLRLRHRLQLSPKHSKHMHVHRSHLRKCRLSPSKCRCLSVLACHFLVCPSLERFPVLSQWDLQQACMVSHCPPRTHKGLTPFHLPTGVSITLT